MFYKSIEIAGLKIPGNLFLAPMAGYTDLPFRQIVSELGASLAFTEMVSAEAICRENKKTFRLAQASPSSPYHAIQIFGSEPKRCGEAALRLMALKPHLLDLNCGCPVPKVIKTGAGSALMRQPSQIFLIIREMRKALDENGGESIPVSVKIRSGWDDKNENFKEVIDAAKEGGGAMVSIHSRTRAQGYSGYANSQVIKEAVDYSSLPICASGDLFTAVDAVRIFCESGCDAVMFARGSVGNPWIFTQTHSILSELTQNESLKEMVDNKLWDQLLLKISPISTQQIIELAWRHLKLSFDTFGASYGVREMKKQLCGYTKGIPKGKLFRNELVRSQSFEEYQAAFASYWPDGIDFE